MLRPGIPNELGSERPKNANAAALQSPMSVETYRRDVLRHQQDLARLQQEKSREAAKAANETKRANAAAESSTRATHASTAQSKLREADRYRSTALRHQQKVAEIE